MFRSQVSLVVIPTTADFLLSSFGSKLIWILLPSNSKVHLEGKGKNISKEVSLCPEPQQTCYLITKIFSSFQHLLDNEPVSSVSIVVCLLAKGIEDIKGMFNSNTILKS